jgi:hypothetical protein
MHLIIRPIDLITSLFVLLVLLASTRLFNNRLRKLHVETTIAFTFALCFGVRIACISTLMYVLISIARAYRTQEIEFSLIQSEFSHLLLVYLCFAVYTVGNGFDPVIESCILGSGDIFYDTRHKIREISSCSDEIEASIHMVILLVSGEFMLLVLAGISMNILFKWELHDINQELIMPQFKVAILKSICVPFTWICVSRMCNTPLPSIMTWDTNH